MTVSNPWDTDSEVPTDQGAPTLWAIYRMVASLQSDVRSIRQTQTQVFEPQLAEARDDIRKIKQATYERGRNMTIERRRWLYGAITAAAPLLVWYGVVEENAVPLWIAAIGAWLGTATATGVTIAQTTREQ